MPNVIINIRSVVSGFNLATWDHLFGALATYKRIITIAGCANTVLSFIIYALIRHCANDAV